LQSNFGPNSLKIKERDTDKVTHFFNGLVESKFLNAPVQLKSDNARPCPLCGASERKVLARREPWEIVRCARCAMVFIGSELPYDIQARDHDWMDEHAKAASARKKNQPIFVFLSRVLKPLRPHTEGRMLSQTLRWARAGKLGILAAATGDSCCSRRNTST
jgi:hypothetical protein